MVGLLLGTFSQSLQKANNYDNDCIKNYVKTQCTMKVEYRGTEHNWRVSGTLPEKARLR